jgi:hypothetical protein
VAPSVDPISMRPPRRPALTSTRATNPMRDGARTELRESSSGRSPGRSLRGRRAGPRRASPSSWTTTPNDA